MCSYDEVLSFWFEELSEAQWWAKDRGLDSSISERFLPTWEGACVDRCKAWRESAEGRLAEVIVLDQFSRNIFRDTKRAFENDELALSLAEQAVKVGADQSLTSRQLPFLYMPFMHSESKAAHEKAVQLFSKPGLESNFEFELKHKVIIERFGRYPHRNEILGRESTLEELKFLEQSDSSF